MGFARKGTVAADDRVVGKTRSRSWPARMRPVACAACSSGPRGRSGGSALPSSSGIPGVGRGCARGTWVVDRQEPLQRVGRLVGDAGLERPRDQRAGAFTHHAADGRFSSGCPPGSTSSAFAESTRSRSESMSVPSRSKTKRRTVTPCISRTTSASPTPSLARREALSGVVGRSASRCARRSDCFQMKRARRAACSG